MGNERKMVTKVVEEYFSFDGKTLAEMKEMIEDWVSHYGDNSIIASRWGYGDSKHLTLEQVHPETDEEMNKRIAAEEHSRKRNEQYERQQLAALQAKYGKEGV